MSLCPKTKLGHFRAYYLLWTLPGGFWDYCYLSSLEVASHDALGTVQCQGFMHEVHLLQLFEPSPSPVGLNFLGKCSQRI